MTDDDLLLIVALMTIITLYAGYLVNKWKIKDLEDRVEKLERKDD